MNTGIPKQDLRSRERLKGVHPLLVKVIEHAQPGAVKYIVTEGVRTIERQRQLKAAGASQTLNSKHLTGRAVDLAVWVGNEIRWDWPLYAKLADEIKLSAHVLSVAIVWGGDWKSFPDGPHFELADSVM